MGSLRMRRPVACQTALAIAAFMPTIPISPRPLMPGGLTRSSRSATITTLTFATSALTGMWYSDRLSLT